MRVVAHNGALIWGGAERATVSLLQGLKERGHDVHLLCNNDLVARQSIARGVPATICIIGGDAMIHHSYSLARALRRLEPDAFIVGTYKKLFFATLGARMARVPRIVARVGLESDTPRSLKYRIALRRWTDGVVVNAERMAGPFAGLRGFGPEKVKLIWNSVRVAPEHERRHEVRDEIGVGHDAFVIGTVARLSKQKRLDRLIRVTALTSNAHCIIAGDGALRTALEQLAGELGVSDRVHFLGERDDVSNVLAAFDVYAVTSDSEGLSNSMLEAMAHGLPIVSTDVSGAHDALAADEGGDAAGVIVPFDTDAIAKAVASLRDDPVLRSSLGSAARKRAAQRFSRERMITEWEEFLSTTSER
jgi:glycosyltransferase involved in cell wall biosynthesis